MDAMDRRFFRIMPVRSHAVRAARYPDHVITVHCRLVNIPQEDSAIPSPPLADFLCESLIASSALAPLKPRSGTATTSRRPAGSRAPQAN
jgi:hypothetical protein